MALIWVLSRAPTGQRHNSPRHRLGFLEGDAIVLKLRFCVRHWVFHNPTRQRGTACHRNAPVGPSLTRRVVRKAQLQNAIARPNGAALTECPQKNARAAPLGLCNLNPAVPPGRCPGL
ncbi:hypothetical protein RB11672 [Rhodopirellula baltica SH 1]|uniref:Uncharacterized protein n=1 Tax=Rhodopirellula baltica (strain DSM 10527 / NCIMB 13988 / SH1) TaxID=243090 RepID=Q7UE02_RHOBA|nr:hypothetical protein RB11672 [Rhodopirellula baltica SH 1]